MYGTWFFPPCLHTLAAAPLASCWKYPACWAVPHSAHCAPVASAPDGVETWSWCAPAEAGRAVDRCAPRRPSSSLWPPWPPQYCVAVRRVASACRSSVHKRAWCASGQNPRMSHTRRSGSGPGSDSRPDIWAADRHHCRAAAGPGNRISTVVWRFTVRCTGIEKCLIFESYFTCQSYKKVF